MSLSFAYIFLAVSIAAEVAAATFVTASKGFTALKPTIICVAGYLYYKQKLTRIGVASLILIITATITLNLWGSY